MIHAATAKRTRTVVVGLRVLTCVAFFTAGLGGQTVVREIRTPRILDRAITVPAGQNAETLYEAVARRFIAENSSGASILRLTMAPDQMTLVRALDKSVHNTSFDSLLAEIRRLGLPQGPVARLLSIGGAALFTYRGDGKYEEKVLLGNRDPRVLWAGESEFHLLHFHLAPTPGGGVPPASRVEIASFYLEKHGKISVIDCVSLARRLKLLSGIPIVSVDVRPIPWFIGDNNFPDVFPFVRTISVPTEGEYDLLLPHVACVDHPIDGVDCGGNHFVP